MTMAAPETKQWLHYYHQVVEESMNFSPKGKLLSDLLEQHLTISDRELRSGHVAETNTRRIFLSLDHRRTRQQTKTQVIILPYVYRKGRDLTPILCIPATLEKTGELTPGEDDPLPWIPPAVLEPSQVNGLAIGTQESAEQYFAPSHDEEQDEQDPDTWQYILAKAHGLLAHVTGLDIPTEKPDYEDQGYKTLEEILVLLRNDDGGASIHILQLYKDIIAGDLRPPLLERILNGTTVLRRLDDEKKNYLLSARHLGTMHQTFPLSPSQRLAINHYCVGKDGDILAVNGPPGTGKTTLIQTIVAQKWIETALAKAKHPPCIVGTAATNQAVTNIIDSFTKQADEDNSRWLPEVASYGLYAVSSWRKDIDPKYHVHYGGRTPRTGPEPLEKTVLSPSWYQNACRCYVSKSAEHYGEGIDTVLKGLTAVHEELKKTSATIGAIITTSGELFPEDGTTTDPILKYMDDQAQKLEKQLYEEQNSFQRVKNELAQWQTYNQASLDYLAEEPLLLTIFSLIPPVQQKRNARYALHMQKAGFRTEGKTLRQIQSLLKDALNDYWQAVDNTEKTIKELGDHLDENRRKKQNLIAACEAAGKPITSTTTYEELLAHLDTTLRYTAFQLAARYWEGRYLVSWQQKRTGTMLPCELTPCIVTTLYMLPHFFKAIPIDHLIIDEAGQASPEKAVPAFALAKRALVVGDVYQIEPVWDIPAQKDWDLLVKHRIVNDAADYERTKKEKPYASSGNIMKLAQDACEYHHVHDLPKGIFLCEHRRCVPAIIGYCNKIIYKDLLTPCRPEIEHRILPAMAIIDVLGEDHKVGGSRANAEEASAVARWIADNAGKIMSHYGQKDIGDLLGVITPFTAQKQVIQRALHRTLGRTHDIQVGTVHTFQGAEKNIILFSPTYGIMCSGNAYFFDRTPNMLNVAVSRAKDTFLILGNERIFKNAPSATPSGFLYQWICNH